MDRSSVATMQNRHRPKNNGFTLIEVMVALTIIALTLGAIITSSGSQASQAAYLKQKTIAHWVALNEITRLQINNTWPDAGNEEGTTTMANNVWFWTKTVKKTEDENSRQITYQLFSDKERKKNLTSLTAYTIK